MTTDETPPVTILVAPRERFSVAPAALDRLLSDTEPPFGLVYVDGGSPARVREHVAAAARRHGFRHIRTERHLSPNEARNLGLRDIEAAAPATPYVVFIDNDVIVAPGWLRPLVACAEETGAAIVSPLICQGAPLHRIVHCAGGLCRIREIGTERGTERHFQEQIFKQGRPVAAVRPGLRRGPTELAEFHCMLVRMDALRAIGYLDEAMRNTREHLDLCLAVAARGGTIWLEPDSLVTYLNDAPIGLRDIPYFMLRWSDAWERQSLLRFRQKWDLSLDGTLGHRLRNVGWRRRYKLLTPIAAGLALRIGFLRRPLEKALYALDRPLNAAITARHARRSGVRP